MKLDLTTKLDPVTGLKVCAKCHPKNISLSDGELSKPSKQGDPVVDKEYVHFVFIVDRSGSMNTIRKDTEEGIHAFTEKMLEGVDASKRTASFYQFDTIHDRVWDFDLLEKVKDYKLEPRGGTALLDACGQAITEVGAKLAAMPERKRPGYVMVIIATDGEENSSKEYTKPQIKKMIEHQQ